MSDLAYQLVSFEFVYSRGMAAQTCSEHPYSRVFGRSKVIILAAIRCTIRWGAWYEGAETGGVRGRGPPAHATVEFTVGGSMTRPWGMSDAS
jgi:hypothetical protein